MPNCCFAISSDTLIRQVAVINRPVPLPSAPKASPASERAPRMTPPVNAATGISFSNSVYKAP